MNAQNLIPNSQRTPSELREMTRRAGIASGKARREKRMLKDIYEFIGSSKLKNKKLENAIADNFALKNKDFVHDFAVACRLFMEAEGGNIQAARTIAEIRGELRKTAEISGKIQVEQPLFGDGDDE